jgi:hypothetical protein
VKRQTSKAALAGALFAAAAMPAAPATAQIGLGSPWFDNDGPVTIWVTIRARRGEAAWPACRRVYQRDVYQAVPLGNGRVRCRIDHSRIYDPGNVRQNFNRR